MGVNRLPDEQLGLMRHDEGGTAPNWGVRETGGIESIEERGVLWRIRTMGMIQRAKCSNLVWPGFGRVHLNRP